MIHRRALILTTNLGLIIFLIVLVGAIAWTIDEAMGWDLLPNWLQRLAKALILLTGLIMAFAAVVSVMCSLAVIAEANAAQAGMTTPPLPSAARWALWLAAPALVAALFVMHLVDLQFEARRQQEEAARRAERSAQLQLAAQAAVEKFAPALREKLSCVPDGAAGRQADVDIARLMNAISASTLNRPSVRLLLPAEEPYRFCIVEAEALSYCQDRSKPRDCLTRNFLTQIPSEWENDSVSALFEGRSVDVVAGVEGVFLDTTSSSGWAPVGAGGDVTGILSLRAP